jgi:dTMP kinase
LKTRKFSSGGLFVTFEGIDGTGKTTCLHSVAAMLRHTGEEVVTARLPGSAPGIGDGIRQLLFHDPTTKEMAPGVADLLFLADQVQCTAKVIVPALNACKIVLCDRYTDSQFAYSAHPSKQSPSWANEFYSRLDIVQPDVTILFVGDPDAMWARSKGRAGAEGAKQDGKTWEGALAQSLIQGAYLGRLRHLERTRIIYVDGRSAEAVAARVFDLVKEEL